MTGAPEKAFHDAELIAVYSLAIDDFTGTVGGQLAVAHEEIVVFDLSNGLRTLSPFFVLLLLLVCQRFLLACFLVDEQVVIFFLPQQFVAPPFVILRFRRHLLVVLSAEVQVFECELFQLLGVCRNIDH